MAKEYKWYDKSREYNGIRLVVDDFKENGYYQFRLDTILPFIDTNRDFKTPEHAFKYAEERMRVEFTKIVSKLKRGEYEKEHTERFKGWGSEDQQERMVHMDSRDS